jgi:hypothetical protein
MEIRSLIFHQATMSSRLIHLSHIAHIWLLGSKHFLLKIMVSSGPFVKCLNSKQKRIQLNEYYPLERLEILWEWILNNQHHIFLQHAFPRYIHLQSFYKASNIAYPESELKYQLLCFLWDLIQTMFCLVYMNHVWSKYYHHYNHMEDNQLLKLDMAYYITRIYWLDICLLLAHISHLILNHCKIISLS